MIKRSAWKRFPTPGGFQYGYPEASMLSNEQAAMAAGDVARQIRARKSGIEGAQDWVLLALRLALGTRRRRKPGRSVAWIGRLTW